MKRNSDTPSLLRSFASGAALVALAATMSTASARALVQRASSDLEHLNLNDARLALDGYDPVAYFPEGGGQAREGKAKLSVEFRAVTYRFASEKNWKTFQSDPEKYEPDYGGWCAYAMSRGDKVEVDPESFLIEEGRLLVFFDGFFADTRKSWLSEGGAKLGPSATKEWGEILGRKESVRPRAKEATLGLNSMDPLTVGQGREAKPGLATIATRIGDLEYRFATAENRLEFLRDPERVLAALEKD